MTELFPGSREERIRAGEAELFVRILGEGPPVLLLHGFPQTHAMWHRIAPALARGFTLVMPDLRGYGRSSAPASDKANRAYSKRRMGEDMAAVMESLGHRSFAVIGHDRGARVAYRLALDAPERVKMLALLDILPTYAVWRGLTPANTMTMYHWLFLAQPSPLPETLIGGNPQAYLDHTLASWTKTRSLDAFDPAALDDYRACFAREGRIAGACNDYRAGATIDWKDDETTLDQGDRIHCPTLLVWGEHGSVGKGSSPPAVWAELCSDARGQAIDSAHFVAEENPEELLAQLEPFLAEHAA